MTRTGASWWMVAAALAVMAGGCDKSDGDGDDGQAAPVVAAPAPITVTAEQAGLVYRYVDPGSGEVATATSVDAIPEAARREVVVFDPDAPPPAGWDQVADLSAGLPATTTPRQGFSLAVPAATAPLAAPVAKSRHEVVMFTRDGCGFCRRARKWLTAKKVPFSEHNLDHEPKAASELAQHAKRAGLPATQLNGVPVIFVDDAAIVGFDQARLAKLLGV